MGAVYNPTHEDVSVKALGNWFNIKAGQIKVMDDKISHYLTTDKGYLGLASLPDICIEDPTSAEATVAKEEARKMGIAKRVDHLNKVVNNLTVSLRRDLEQANIKTDPLLYASEGELAAFKALKVYKAAHEDDASKRADEIKQIQDEIKKAE